MPLCVPMVAITASERGAATILCQGFLFPKRRRPRPLQWKLRPHRWKPRPHQGITHLNHQSKIIPSKAPTFCILAMHPHYDRIFFNKKNPDSSHKYHFKYCLCTHKIIFKIFKLFLFWIKLRIRNIINLRKIIINCGILIRVHIVICNYPGFTIATTRIVTTTRNWELK